MTTSSIRPWLIRWMWGAAALHLAIGLALPWITELGIFQHYHQVIETGFWPQSAPSAARAQQAWWVSLFGPTIQSLSIWMGALILVGDRQRSTLAWAALALGILLWAPQDMLVSLRAGAWLHVWIDAFAVLSMLPPLAWLWRIDHRASQETLSLKLSQEAA